MSSLICGCYVCKGCFICNEKKPFIAGNYLEALALVAG
ncbi:hypothetical protein [Anaplasma phagocytophilum]